MNTKVAQMVQCVKLLNKRDRHLFVIKLMGLEDVAEDLYDIAELRRTRHERGRPYDEVVKDLRAKSRL